MEHIEKIIHSKIFKHTFGIVFIIAMLGWAGFRFATIASENRREVYNISRVSADQGIPVETIVITTKTDPTNEKDKIPIKILATGFSDAFLKYSSICSPFAIP